MNGLHRALNTKADYMYIKKNEPEIAWREAYQTLLDGVYCWQPLGDTESADDYAGDSVRVVSAGEDGNMVTQVYKQDANCKLFRIGFTVSDIEAALN